MSKKQTLKIVNFAVKSSFKEGKLLEPQVIKIIKTFKKLNTSEAVQTLTEYMKGIKRVLREYTLTIESAVPLSQSEVSKIKKSLDRDFKISQIQVNINPEILGGIRIRLGDTVIDNSIKAKIEQVKEAIIK